MTEILYSGDLGGGYRSADLPPHLKLSSVADEVLADLRHFTESPFETVG